MRSLKLKLITINLSILSVLNKFSFNYIRIINDFWLGIDHLNFYFLKLRNQNMRIVNLIILFILHFL